MAMTRIYVYDMTVGLLAHSLERVRIRQNDNNK